MAETSNNDNMATVGIGIPANINDYPDMFAGMKDPQEVAAERAAEQEARRQEVISGIKRTRVANLVAWRGAADTARDKKNVDAERRRVSEALATRAEKFGSAEEIDDAALSQEEALNIVQSATFVRGGDITKVKDAKFLSENYSDGTFPVSLEQAAKIELRQQHGRSHAGGDIIKKIKQGGVEARDAINEWLYGRKDDAGSDWIVGNPNYRADYTADEMAAVIASIKLSRYLDAEVAASEGADQEVVRVARVLAANPSIPRAVQTKMLASLGLERSQQAADLAQNYRRRREVESGWFSGAIEGAKGIYRDWEGLAKMLSVAFSDDYYPYVAVMEAAPDDVDAKEWLKGLSEQEVEQKFGKSKKKVLEAFDNGEKVATEFLATLNAQDLSRANYADSSGQEAAEMFVRFLPDVVLTLIVAAMGGGEAAAGVGGTALVGGQAAAKAAAKKLAVKEMAKRLISAARKRAVKKLTTRKGLASLALTVATTADFGVPQGVDFARRAVEEKWNASPTELIGGAAVVTAVTGGIEKIQWELLTGAAGRALGVKFGGRTLFQQLSSAHRRSGIERLARLMLGSAATLPAELLSESIEEALQEAVGHLTPAALGITDVNGKSVFSMSDMANGILENAIGAAAVTPWMIVPFRALSTARAALSRIRASDGSKKTKSILTVEQGVLNALAEADAIAQAMAAGKGQLGVSAKELLQIAQIADPKEREKVYKEKGWDSRQRERAEIVAEYAQNSIRYKQRLDEAAKKKSGDAGQQRRTKGAKTVTTVVNNKGENTGGKKNTGTKGTVTERPTEELSESDMQKETSAAIVRMKELREKRKELEKKKAEVKKTVLEYGNKENAAMNRGDELTYEEQQKYDEAAAELIALNTQLKNLTEERKKLISRVTAIKAERSRRAALVDSMTTDAKLMYNSDIDKAVADIEKRLAEINGRIQEKAKKGEGIAPSLQAEQRLLAVRRAELKAERERRAAELKSKKTGDLKKRLEEVEERMTEMAESTPASMSAKEDAEWAKLAVERESILEELQRRKTRKNVKQDKKDLEDAKEALKTLANVEESLVELTNFVLSHMGIEVQGVYGGVVANRLAGMIKHGSTIEARRKAATATIVRYFCGKDAFDALFGTEAAMKKNIGLWRVFTAVMPQLLDLGLTKDGGKDYGIIDELNVAIRLFAFGKDKVKFKTPEDVSKLELISPENTRGEFHPETVEELANILTYAIENNQPEVLRNVLAIYATKAFSFAFVTMKESKAAMLRGAFEAEKKAAEERKKQQQEEEDAETGEETGDDDDDSGDGDGEGEGPQTKTSPTIEAIFEAAKNGAKWAYRIVSRSFIFGGYYSFSRIPFGDSMLGSAGVRGIMPYNLLGNKSRLIASHPSLIRAFGAHATAMGGAVYDLFGGAATWTTFLAENGLLPKGSVLNEYSESRWNALSKLINGDQDKIAARLADAASRFYASEEYAQIIKAQADKRNMDNATANRMAARWFSDELSGLHGATGYIDENGHLAHTEEVAALYILIQNFSSEPVDFVAKDGNGTYTDSNGGQELWDYRSYLAKKNEKFTTIDGAKAFVAEFANKFKGKDVYVLRGDAIAKITGEKEEFNNGEIPPIKAGSVIFLDPPYMGTKGYSQDKTSSGYENPAHFEAEMNKVIDYLVQHGLMNNVTLVITNQFEASVDRSNKTAEKAANKRIETIQKIATRATYEYTENGQVYHIPAMAVGIGSRSDRDAHRGSKEVGEEELKKRGGHGAEGVAKPVVLNEVMMVSDGCAHLMTPSAFDVEFVCKEHPELTAEEAVQIIERARKAQYAQAIEEVAATKEGEEGAKLREKKQELLDKADEQRKTRTSRALRNYGARATTRASRGLLSQFIRSVAGWLRGTAIVVLSDDEFERRVATVQNGRASLAEYFPPDKEPMQLIAYGLHAASAKFPEFDLNHVLSGEGAVAYGVGNYLALNNGVHRFYLGQALDRGVVGVSLNINNINNAEFVESLNTAFDNSYYRKDIQKRVKLMLRWRNNVINRLRELYPQIANDPVMLGMKLREILYENYKSSVSGEPFGHKYFARGGIEEFFIKYANAKKLIKNFPTVVMDEAIYKKTGQYVDWKGAKEANEYRTMTAIQGDLRRSAIAYNELYYNYDLDYVGLGDVVLAFRLKEYVMTASSFFDAVNAYQVSAEEDVYNALKNINAEKIAFSYVVEVDLGINGEKLLLWNDPLSEKDFRKVNAALDEIIANGGDNVVPLDAAKKMKDVIAHRGYTLAEIFNKTASITSPIVPTVLKRAGFNGHAHPNGQFRTGKKENPRLLIKSIRRNKNGVGTIFGVPFNLIVYADKDTHILRRRIVREEDIKLFRENTMLPPARKLGPRTRFLRGHDGEIIGMFDSDTGEVMVKEGADLTVVAHELGWHAMFAWARKNAPELYDKLVEVARNAPEEIKQSIRERYGDISEEEFIDECGAAMFESAARAPIEKWIDSVQDKGLKAKLKAWWKAFKTAIMQVWCKMRGNYDTYFTADGKTKVDINKILSKESPAEVIKAIAEAFVDGQILAEAQREMTDGYESGRDSTSGEGTRFARARKPKPMSDVRDKAARDATRGRGKELMPEDRPVATYRTLVRDAVEVMFAAMMKHGIELNDGDNSLGDRAREVVEQAFPDEGSYFYDDILNAARQSAQEAFRRKTQLGLDLTKSVQELAEDIHKAVAGSEAYEANSVVMSTMAAIRDLQSDAEVVAQAKERLRHRSELRKHGRLGKTKAQTRRQLSDMGVEEFSPRQEQEEDDNGDPIYWADKVAEAIKAYFPRKGIALGTLRKTLYAEYNRAARLLNPKTMKKASTLLAELNAANSWDDVLFAARELENLLRGGAVKESAESLVKKIKVLVSRYKSVSRTKIEGERKTLGLDEVFFYTFKRAAFASGKRKMSIEDIDTKINELTAKLAPSAEAANEKGVGAVGEWGRTPAGEEALQQRAALELARQFLVAQLAGDIEALARIQGILLARQTEGKKTLDEKKKEQSDAAKNDADALAKAIYVEGRNKAGAHEGSLLNTLGGLFTGTLSWKQQLEDAIRFATGEVKAKAQSVIEKLNKAVADADYKAAQINQRNNQWLCDTLVDIWGTGAEGKDASARAHEASKIMSTLSAPSEEYARFSADGKTPLSYAQILQLYASLRQRDVQRPFDGLEELPPEAQRAKVAEMGEGAQRLWARLQQLDELQEEVGEKGERYLDACSQKYLEDAEELDEVAMDITGVPLSLQNADYYPICRDFERVMLNSPSGGLGYVPTIMTPRTSNKLDLDEQADAFSMWRRRSADTAHFIAFGRLHMHLGKVFGNEQFSDALRRTQGKARTGQLVNHTRAILSPQMMGSGLYDRMVGAMGWMASIAAHAALGMNILTMIRQVTSVPAFAFTNGMTAGETILSSLKGVFTAGGWERMKKIAASDGFRERYGTGEFESQMSILAAKGGSAMLRRAFRYYMSTNRFGDRVPILLVGQAILAAKVQELQGQINPETGEPFTAEEAEAEAMKSVWELADKSQQATRTADKGSWQLNPVGRFIMQFQTATSQFAAAEVLAVKQFAANPHWDAAGRHLAHVIFTNHVLLPCAYTLAGTLFQALTGGYDDDDDWGWSVFGDFWKAMLLGPSAGIFVLGSIITSLVTDKRMRAGQAPSSEIISQSLNVVRHAGHGEFGKALDDIVDAVPLTREGRDFCEHWFDADLTAGD